MLETLSSCSRQDATSQPSSRPCIVVALPGSRQQGKSGLCYSLSELNAFQRKLHGCLVWWQRLSPVCLLHTTPCLQTGAGTLHACYGRATSLPNSCHVHRWMTAQAEGKQPSAACLAVLRKGAEFGSRDKSVEIREASTKLAALCAGSAEASARHVVCAMRCAQCQELRDLESLLCQALVGAACAAETLAGHVSVCDAAGSYRTTAGSDCAHSHDLRCH